MLSAARSLYSIRPTILEIRNSAADQDFGKGVAWILSI